jgi:hypothetical protein
MYLIVVGFTVGEDFAIVLDWSLYHVDVPGFLRIYHQDGTDNLGGCCDV